MKPNEKQLTSRRKKKKKSIKMAWRWEVRKTENTEISRRKN